MLAVRVTKHQHPLQPKLKQTEYGKDSQNEDGKTEKGLLKRCFDSEACFN